jgi:tetratricopeptide (TPR) repeat protein
LLIEAATFPSWVVSALLGVARDRADHIASELKRAQLMEDTGRDTTGYIRFRFHDLVRDLARELLQDAERADGIRQLVDAYASLAACAHTLLEPPSLGRGGDNAFPDYLSKAVAGINADWFAWFRDDRQNLLDVIRAASQEQLWAATSQLCELLTALVEVPSYWDDWSQVSEIALEANRRSGLRAAEARTLRHLGDLRVYQGRRAEAKARLQESVGIFQELGDRAGEAASLIRLGEVLRLTGDSAGALESMEHGHIIYQHLGDELGTAYALTSIGGVLRVRAGWDESIEAFQRCIPVLKAAGRRRQAAIALVSLGDVYYLKSMWTEAMQCFDDCLTLFAGLRDQMWMQNTRRHIGLVHLILGRPGDAMRCFSEALITFEQIGDRRKEALTRWAIGDLHASEEQFSKSIASYRAALAVFQDINDGFCQAHVLREIAHVGVRLHDDRADQWVDASLAAAKALKDDLMWAKARIGLAELRHYQNRLEEAIAVAQRSLNTFREPPRDRLWQAKALTCLTASYIDYDEPTPAQETLAEALTIYQDIDVPTPAQLQVMRNAIDRRA